MKPGLRSSHHSFSTTDFKWIVSVPPLKVHSTNTLMLQKINKYTVKVNHVNLMVESKSSEDVMIALLYEQV